MRAIDAIRKMLADKHLTKYGVSQKLGKSHAYVQTMLRQGTIGADKLSEVAEVCGYALVLVPAKRIPDDAIVIDDSEPPEEGDEEEDRSDWNVLIG